MRKDYSLISILLFFIQPFLAFLIACTDLTKRANGITFVLFYGLFGYCHTFKDIRADGYRKMLEFMDTDKTSLIDILSQYMEGDIMDIYQSIIFNWIISFTNNPHIMMMIVGIIGGIFCLKLLKRILAEYSESFNIYICCLLILISLPISPVHMGGIRGFTALSVFAYSAIKLLIDKKRAWIIPIFFTPLIHFGYLLVVGYILIILILPYRHNLFFWPAIIACIASLFLDTQSWVTVAENATLYVDNDAITQRTNHYTDIDTGTEFNRSLTTKALNIQNKILAWYVVILLIYLRRNWEELNHSQYSYKIYNYALSFTFLGFGLLSFSVVGQRYLYLCWIMLGLFLLVLYNKNRNSTIRLLIAIIPLVFLGHILWVIYNSYVVTGTTLYYQSLPQLTLLR